MILNMTQHAASAEQKAAGTVDLAPSEAAELRRLLTFNELPTEKQIEERAAAIVGLARAHFRKLMGRVASGAIEGEDIRCMIGGAPFLMPALTQAMRRGGFVPVCAFSRRESVEESLADGSVVKRSVFQHLGFVELSTSRGLDSDPS